jgi:hypothetical protein
MERELQELQLQVAAPPNRQILQLFFDNPEGALNAIAEMDLDDKIMIIRYIYEMADILQGLAQAGQEETIPTGQICTRAGEAIMKFTLSGGNNAHREKFIITMRRYINTLTKNKSETRQIGSDFALASAIAGGTLSTFWSINMWNFGQIMSALFAIAQTNPVAMGAAGAVMGFDLKEYSLTDYLSYIFVSRERPASMDEVWAQVENTIYENVVDGSENRHYIYEFATGAAKTTAQGINTIGNALLGNAITHNTERYLHLKQAVEREINAAFDARDHFQNLFLTFMVSVIIIMIYFWYIRLQQYRSYKSRKGDQQLLQLMNSPMAKAPRRKSRSRRMNTAVKKKSTRRKSTRRKSRSPKRKSTRRKSTRRKSRSPKRKGMSRRRKSRRKSKSPKRKSKSKRRKSRRKSKSPKRKSKSKRRKSRRKSKSPKRKSKSRRRKSTRKGQVRKTSRRAYMDTKTKPRRKSRSRRRKDMM